MKNSNDFIAKGFIFALLGVCLFTAGATTFSLNADMPQLIFNGALLGVATILLLTSLASFWKARKAPRPANPYDVPVRKPKVMFDRRKEVADRRQNDDRPFPSDRRMEA